MTILKLKLFQSFKLALVGALVFVNLQVASASDGGANGGGGNVCSIAGRTVALDVVGVRSDFEKELSDVAPMIILPSKIVSDVGSDQIDISGKFSSYFLEIEEGLRKVNAIKQANLFANAVKSLAAHSVSRRAKKAIGADFSNKWPCNSENTRAVIYYHKLFGIFIDVPRFNQLNAHTQFVLLLHEANRNIQKRFGSSVSDLELQKATGLMMAKDFEAVKQASIFHVRKQTAQERNLLRSLCTSFPDYLATDAGFMQAKSKVCSDNNFQIDRRIILTKNLYYAIRLSIESLLDRGKASSQVMHDLLSYEVSVHTLYMGYLTESLHKDRNQKVILPIDFAEPTINADFKNPIDFFLSEIENQ